MGSKWRFEAEVKQLRFTALFSRLVRSVTSGAPSVSTPEGAFPSALLSPLPRVNSSWMKKYVAEGIGTFALVFAGTGAIVINEVSGGAITHAGIALTFGLVVLAMIYTV